MDYAEDVEEAIVALLEGNVWEEALRLVYFHQRMDLLETHLKPSLLEAHQSQMALFESLQSTYLRHSSRLLVVRETKRQKQNAILGWFLHTVSVYVSRTCTTASSPSC